MKVKLKHLGILSLLSMSPAMASELTIMPMIVGGGEAEVGPYEWTVSLQNSSGNHRCGASLIAPRWVVTAEHCVDHVSDLSNPVELQVVVGRADLNSSDGYERDVSEVIFHPDLGTGIDHEHDIALLKLSSAVNGITPIAIADSQIMDLVGNPGDISKVLGWGDTEEGGSGVDQLREVDVPIVSNSQCNDDYNGEISDNMLCAGIPEGGIDACQGDSGGPLVVNNSGTFHLAGIVSWGKGCARPDYPGVYTRVESFASWIIDNTGASSGGSGSGFGSSNTELENGVPVNGLSANEDSQLAFTLEVPSNASNLTINIDGGSGDADLYVKFDSAPSTSSYDCRPYEGGNTESCEFPSPQAGTYHIMLNGYRDFSGVTLVGNYDVDNITPITEPEDGAVIQIQNRDKDGYLATDGNDVAHQSSNSGDETLWTLTEAGTDIYYLNNNDNNRNLDYDSDGDVDTSSNTGTDKKWKLIKTGDYYLIRNMSSDEYLDADSSGRVDTSTNTDHDKQWIITVIN